MTLPTKPPRRLHSPCIGVCSLETDTGLCTGCLRTIDEIAGWGSMRADQRAQVWEALDERRRARGDAGAASSHG